MRTRHKQKIAENLEIASISLRAGSISKEQYALILQNLKKVVAEFEERLKKEYPNWRRFYRNLYMRERRRKK